MRSRSNAQVGEAGDVLRDTRSLQGRGNARHGSCYELVTLFRSSPFARSSVGITTLRWQEALWAKLVFVLGCAFLLPTGAASAEQVSVRYTEGLLHGFLALRTLEGKSLADGELTQVAEGDRVKSHLVFRFKDGSLYDETALFLQRGKFRFLSDHVIEKGPSFKHPIETSIDAATGQAMVRYTDDDGKEQTIGERLSLPEDVANGLLFTLVRHIQPGVPQTIVHQVAMTPKPRLVELVILPQGEEPFSSGSIKHKAMHYVVKVKIGGIAGLLAPLLGKQPADMQIWVLEGEAPAFVKFEGPLYNGGPIWRVELAAPAGFP